MDSREVLVLWRNAAWRCEFQPGIAGQARLLVFHEDTVVAAESVPSGRPAYLRAEVLRERVRRGDLRPQT
jgi:hypothetical protein